MTENILNEQKNLILPIFYDFPAGLYQNILNLKIYLIILIVILIIIQVYCSMALDYKESERRDFNILSSLTILVKCITIFHSLIFIRFLFSYSKDELIGIHTNYYYINLCLNCLIFLEHFWYFFKHILFELVHIFSNESPVNPELCDTLLTFVFSGITFILTSYLPFWILNYIDNTILMRILLLFQSLLILTIYYYIFQPLIVYTINYYESLLLNNINKTPRRLPLKTSIEF